MKFKSKVVLVTGSSNNIGRAIAKQFAAEGAHVIVTAKNNIAGGKRVVDEIKNTNGKAIFVQADLADPNQVKQLFKTAMAEFGSVDILINNAGSASQKAFIESDKEHWLSVFNDNFFSSVLCSIEAAKIMQANSSRGLGRIINTASIRGLEHAGRAGVMAYSAAKAALINFTKTLAKDLAPHILVNAVAPGFTLTSAFDDVPDVTKDGYIEGTLIKRWLTVDEVAEAFLYLAGADGITGEVLVIDGGWSLK
jgi:3-oxoacyl-[acyl-carrier protein] reductase